MSIQGTRILVDAHMSELEAINEMLSLIGEQPVNSLDDTASVSFASLARKTLNRVSRQVQTSGLHCNTEYNYELTPDVDGYVNLPNNTMRVDASAIANDYIQRGMKLYDKDNHTYIFTNSSIELDIIFFLEWELLPQVVRDYIWIVAARAFVAKTRPSETLDGLTQDDQDAAFINFQNAELENGDYNIHNNYSASNIIGRNRNPVKLR
nr:hypothetical protein 6 [Deltaproteobacteria bacterium]